MLPTPAKFHYIFNMRDLSRIFQGILTAPIDVINVKNESIYNLWYHECERVLCDKLVNAHDKDFYHNEAHIIMNDIFGNKIAQPIVEDIKKNNVYFVDFLEMKLLMKKLMKY